MIKPLVVALSLFAFAVTTSGQEDREEDYLDTETEISDIETREDLEDEMDSGLEYADENEETSEEEVSQEEGQLVEETVEVQRPGVRIVPFYQKQTPKLTRITRHGAYLYNTEKSEQSQGVSIMAGIFDPSNLSGTTDGVSYNSVYGNETNILFSFRYEYQLFQSAGKLALSTGFGIAGVTGKARFANDPDTVAEEDVALFITPVTLEAIYRAQFGYHQIIVPYGGAGVDYFAFTEYRADRSGSDAFKYGGTPTFHWTAGIQLQLDALDRDSIWQIDSEYGINHIYLAGGFRQIISLGKKFDFGSTIFEGGLFFEF